MNLLAGLTNTQRPGLHKKFWTGSSIQLRKMELTANIFTQKTSETSLGLISARWALMVSSDSSPTMAVCFTKCSGTCVMDVSIFHPFLKQKCYVSMSSPFPKMICYFTFYVTVFFHQRIETPSHHSPKANDLSFSPTKPRENIIMNSESAPLAPSYYTVPGKFLHVNQ